MNKEAMLRDVYARLENPNLNWDFKQENDSHIYRVAVEGLTVEVSSYYGGHYGICSGDNATLRIYEGNKVIYQQTDSQGRLLECYNLLEMDRKNKDLRNSAEKECAPLERLVKALDRNIPKR
ncbi:MAG: hypothetical protein AABX05_01425 [Nanoarchaeota archaeon]